MNMTKIDVMRKRIRSWKSRPITHYKINLNPNPTELTIITWIGKHLSPACPPLPRTYLQLYLHAPTKCGKTSLVERLKASGVRVYFFPYEKADWSEGYGDDKYDLVVFDEFHGQKPITFMNSFLDGSTFYMPQRHGGIWKEQYIPCIVNANCMPEVYYYGNDTEQINAFKSRFLFCSFTSLIKILI